jgi:NADPH-dependent 2,4-dienoyl-CoA reductase/sulfur reductase-like enzyme
MCIVNPEIGMEGKHEAKAPYAKKVIVVGGGPAGLEAARVARLREHSVELWDDAPALGGHWSWLIRGFITERRKLLRELGVKLRLGQPISAYTVAATRPDVVLVTPKAIQVPPTIPIAEGNSVVRADEVLDGTAQTSGKVAVIGTNNVGCEVAYVLSRRGVPVILIGEGERIGYGLVRSVATNLTEILGRRKVQIRTGITVRGIQDGRVLCQDRHGHGLVIQAGTFVLALPSQPSTELATELEESGLEVRLLPYCGEPSYVTNAIRIAATIARQI